MMAVCVCVVFQKAKGDWFSWERWRRCGRARPHRPQGDHEQDNTKTRSKGTAVWGLCAVFRNPPTAEVCSSTSVQSTLHPVSPAQGKRSPWVIQMWNQIPRRATSSRGCPLEFNLQNCRSKNWLLCCCSILLLLLCPVWCSVRVRYRCVKMLLATLQG